MLGESFNAVLAVLLLILSYSQPLGALDWRRRKFKPLAKNGADINSYGVDTTFPVHHKLPDGSTFAARYSEFLTGCYEAFSILECDVTEAKRIETNLLQPPLQHNYTTIGFQKAKIPHDLWETLKSYFATRRRSTEVERWPRGNTNTNHWLVSTRFLSLDSKVLGGGPKLKHRVWEEIGPLLEEWVGGEGGEEEELHAISLYGIRVYEAGAIIPPRKLPA